MGTNQFLAAQEICLIICPAYTLFFLSVVMSHFVQGLVINIYVSVITAFYFIKHCSTKHSSCLEFHTKYTLRMPFPAAFTFLTCVGVTAVAWCSSSLADDHCFVATGAFWLGWALSTGALGW